MLKIWLLIVIFSGHPDPIVIGTTETKAVCLQALAAVVEEFNKIGDPDFGKLSGIRCEEQ